jgi:hypothetical protein
MLMMMMLMMMTMMMMPGGGGVTNLLFCFRVANTDSVESYTKTSAVDDLHFSHRETIKKHIS